MNRIVRENYPAAELPKDLTDGMGPLVRVTVESIVIPTPEEKKPFSLDDLLARSPRTFQSADDIVDHIRSLREEWD